MVIFSVVAALVVAAAIYWFLIRDDSDDTKAATKQPQTPAVRTFTAPGASFSFQYPGSFVQTTGPEGYVWIAGVGKYDILSVKRIANEPTSAGRLKAKIPDTLKVVPGTKINGRGTEQHAGVDMVTFSIDTTVDDNAVSVRLYYFSANGVTWQLGCESQKQASVIGAACDAALQSFQGS
ncbi:MAG: hypothetical protein ACJ72D_11720 [Marmoricola sp.]